MTRRLRLGIAGLALAAQMVAGGAAQAQLEEGQVLVGDNVANSIFEVATDGSGSQTVVPTGGPVTYPRAHAVDRNGLIFITGNHLLIRANPVLDTQIPILSMVFPRGVVADPLGHVFAIDLNVALFPPEIIRVDPVLGTATPAARAGYLVFPVGMVQRPNQRLLVADANPGVGACEQGGEEIPLGRGVFEIDPGGFDPDANCANQVIISQNDKFATPWKLSLADDGRIFATDLGGETQGGDPAPPRVIRVNLDGSQTVVAEGGFLQTPIGIAVESASTLLVSDAETVALIRVSQVDLDEDDIDLETNQAIVSEGGDFVVPWDVQIVPPLSPRAEDFFVTDSGSDPSDDAVYRVAGADGARTLISQGGDFGTLAAVALDLDGRLVVTDTEVLKIFRLEPVPSAAQEQITAGGLLDQPTGIVVDATGDYLVTDRGQGAIIRVDPSGAPNATQELLSSGDLLVQPVSAAIDDRGFLIVADAGDPGDPENFPPQVVIVNPVLGTQELLATGGLIPEEPTGAFRDPDGGILITGRGSSKVLRLFPEIESFLIESVSDGLVSPRAVTVDIDRDILVLDSGDELETGDGIVQKVDPVEDFGSPPVPVPTQGEFEDPFGITIDITPEPPAFQDEDEDGIFDGDDNCLVAPNTDQADADQDGCGDACDANHWSDIDCDGVVGIFDFGLLRAQWIAGGVPGVPSADIDGDGVVGIEDWGILRNQWIAGAVTGPSGHPPEMRICDEAPQQGTDGRDCP